MRILTVKRSLDLKSINKSLAIYCSDSSGSVELEGVPCKKVCDLLPGKERTFDADDSEVELFAVAEEGDDRRIVGRYSVDNILNFTKFRLKRNPNAEDGYELVFSAQKVRSPRLSRKAVGAIAAATAIIVILLCYVTYYWGADIYWYFKSVSKQPKQFDTEEFSITLTEAFVRKFPDHDFYAAYYTADDCWVITNTVRFDDAP